MLFFMMVLGVMMDTDMLQNRMVFHVCFDIFCDGFKGHAGHGNAVMLQSIIILLFL